MNSYLKKTTEECLSNVLVSLSNELILEKKPRGKQGEETRGKNQQATRDPSCDDDHGNQENTTLRPREHRAKSATKAKRKAGKPLQTNTQSSPKSNSKCKSRHLA
jgi:hypothetical protein